MKDQERVPDRAREVEKGEKKISVIVLRITVMFFLIVS